MKSIDTRACLLYCVSLASLSHTLVVCAALFTKVRSSRSDPTVRGFSGEKALEAQRSRLKGAASSSPWREEQDKEFKFSKLEVGLQIVGHRAAF